MITEHQNYNSSMPPQANLYRPLLDDLKEVHDFTCSALLPECEILVRMNLDLM